MNQLKHVLFALLIFGALAQSGSAAQPLIQAQGSSPYCLFAVNAYLAGKDMWHLEAEYHRRQLPTWPGTVTPKNPQVMSLATTLYGTRWHVHPYQDFAAAKAGVAAGRRTAFTGNGHAIVVLSIQNGKVQYLDSLNPQHVQVQTEAQLQKMWDGWAWYVQ